MRKWLRRKADAGGPGLPAAAPDEGSACPNCGAPVMGPYCARCGQETTIALPTARTFLREAAGRYVALDGRLWRTLVALLVPGLLTREYLAGRRRRYVRPGRLFLVLSLVLFATFRLVSSAPDFIVGDAAEVRALSPPKEVVDAARKNPAPGITVGDDFNLTLDDLRGPLLTPVRSRIEAFGKLAPQEKSEQIYNGLLRYGPYALVSLLPLFAGLMKLAYVGRARRYPDRPRRYAAHLVFGAHVHAFTFVAVLAFIAIPLPPIRAAIVFWIGIYLLLAVKKVYGGRWTGVVLRACLVGFAYLIMFSVAMAALVVAAVAFR